MANQNTNRQETVSGSSQVIIVIVCKESSVMPLLNYYKCYWWLVTRFQRCTSLYTKSI